METAYRALVGSQDRLTGVLRELRLLTTYTPHTFERAKTLRAEANHAYQLAKGLATEMRRVRMAARRPAPVVGRCATGSCGPRQGAPWPPIVPNASPAPTSDPMVPATTPNAAPPVLPSNAPSTTTLTPGIPPTDNSSDVTPVLPPVTLPPSAAPTGPPPPAGPGMTPSGIPLVPSSGTGTAPPGTTPSGPTSTSVPTLVETVFGSATVDVPETSAPTATIGSLFSSGTVSNGTTTMSADEFDHTIDTAIAGISTVWEEITYILGVFFESFIGLVLGRPRAG